MRPGTRAIGPCGGRVALLAIALVVTVGCGDDSTGSGPTGATDPAGAVDPTVVPGPGPVVLPPLDSPALQGLSVGQVEARGVVDARLEQYGTFDEWNAGMVVLYGDPDAEDPLERPWVMAIVHQGSENSGISDDFDPRGTSTQWRDVPVEQLNQEARQAALLSDGLDDASLYGLVEAVEVTQVDEQDRIEIGFVGLDAAPSTLRLLTSGPLDVGALADGVRAPAPAPSVQWVDRDDPDPSTTRWLTVTSYAADPGVQLLFEATAGGTDVGPSLIAPYVASDDLRLGVRTVGETTALVQASGFDDRAIREILESLAPASGEMMGELASRWFEEPPVTMLPGPATVLTGPALDGRFVLEVSSAPADGPFGPYELCHESLMVTYPDGTFDGGGMSSGGCSEAGTVGVLALRDRATLLHGEVPGDAAVVRLTLDDGEEYEPELVGDDRKAFGVVVDGIRGVRGGEVLDAGGVVLGTLREPFDGAPGSSTTQTFDTPS